MKKTAPALKRVMVAFPTSEEKALLIIEGKELLVSSFSLAEGFESTHKNILALIRKYEPHFQSKKTFAFKKRKSEGREFAYCLLNEEQAKCRLESFAEAIGKSPVTLALAEVQK
ncbi:MAG: hypothetical protein WA705_12430 [Candidatus Ozemobacteraceae bacterium]